MTEREALQELVAAIKDSPLVSHFDGEQRLSDAYNAGVAIIAAPPAPEPVIPAYRGYAALGTGQYVINHSAAGYPAELVITLATEADKAGRQIGESRDNQPDAPLIQADEMVIRIAFTSERGLFALEDQLAWIRRVHFPCPPAPEPPAAPADDLERECADADRICAALGLTVEQSRTEGGSLNVPRIVGHIQETLTALRESHAFGVAMSDKYVASRAPECAAAQKPVAWATPSLLVTLSAVEKNHLTNPDRRTRGGEFESAAADAERYSVPLYAAPPAPASEPTRHPCGHLIVSDECVVCAKPASEPQAEPPAAPVDDLGDDAAVIAFRAQYPSASRAKHVELWTPFLIGWQECAVAARAVLAALRAERDAADKKAEEWADACDRANHALAAAQSVIAAADTQLSRVLHEMAGAVSLCWEPKPTGVFNSTQACEFVAAAIAELRAILHSDAARAGGGK